MLVVWVYFNFLDIAYIKTLKKKTAPLKFSTN